MAYRVHWEACCDFCDSVQTQEEYRVSPFVEVPKPWLPDGWVMFGMGGLICPMHKNLCVESGTVTDADNQ